MIEPVYMDPAAWSQRTVNLARRKDTNLNIIFRPRRQLAQHAAWRNSDTASSRSDASVSNEPVRRPKRIVQIHKSKSGEESSDPKDA